MLSHLERESKFCFPLAMGKLKFPNLSQLDLTLSKFAFKDYSLENFMIAFKGLSFPGFQRKNNFQRGLLWYYPLRYRA